jgi:putative ABC transport system permease protein
MWQDLRYGIRTIARTPAMSAAIAITLGLGVGASTTVFSAIHAVLLRPLPYMQPDRLVIVRESDRRQESGRTGVSAANFVDWRASNPAFDGLAAYRPWGFVLTGDNEPERLAGARVSDDLFSLLGLTPIAGRTFVPGDDREGQRVVLLSEELWRRRFGSDGAILGRTIRLDGEAHVVVGVMPAGIQLPAADVWVPLSLKPYELQQRGARALSVVGRLRNGVTMGAARDHMRAAAAVVERSHPDASAGWTATVTPLLEDVAGAVRRPLAILFAAAIAVLAIACVHLATLVAARSVARRREIAVRMAIGADRRRVVRQLIAEHVVTAAGGAMMAVAVAHAGGRILAGLDRSYLPRAAEIATDPIVMAFAVLVSLGAGVGLAWIAALASTHLDLAQAIRPGVAGRLFRRRIEAGELAVAIQVALTVVLLVGTGLLVRSFLRARAVDAGFVPDRVLAMTVSLAGARYSTNDQKLAFHDSLAQRLGTLPDVRSAALVSHLPLAGAVLSGDLAVEGRAADGVAAASVQMNTITPDYFSTMRIPVIDGRTFGPADRMGTRAVVIVDETLARRYWPPGGAIGRRIRLGATLGADTGWREIVGVVGSVHAASLESAPAPVVYMPYAQNPWPTMNLLVGTPGDPAGAAASVRQAVQSVDPNQPVYNVRPLTAVLERQLAPRRVQVILLGTCAAAALLLSVLGVYAALASMVARRTREVGIRMALGCRPRAVLAWVLGRAFRVLASGAAAGVLCALAGARLLAGLLFNVSAHDPVSLATAVALVMAAGLGASSVPALRATRVDPMLALRRE